MLSPFDPTKFCASRSGVGGPPVRTRTSRRSGSPQEQDVAQAARRAAKPSAHPLELGMLTEAVDERVERERALAVTARASGAEGLAGGDEVAEGGAGERRPGLRRPGMGGGRLRRLRGLGRRRRARGRGGARCAARSCGSRVRRSSGRGARAGRIPAPRGTRRWRARTGPGRAARGGCRAPGARRRAGARAWSPRLSPGPGRSSPGGHGRSWPVLARAAGCCARAARAVRTVDFRGREERAQPGHGARHEEGAPYRVDPDSDAQRKSGSTLYRAVRSAHSETRLPRPGGPRSGSRPQGPRSVLAAKRRAPARSCRPRAKRRGRPLPRA